jgi:hypothetical protein
MSTNQKLTQVIQNRVVQKARQLLFKKQQPFVMTIKSDNPENNVVVTQKGPPNWNWRFGAMAARCHGGCHVAAGF